MKLPQSTQPQDLESANETIAALTSLLAQKDNQITQLEEKVKLLLFRQYAKKSEKLVDPEDPQLGLFDEAKPLSGQQQQNVEHTDTELNQGKKDKTNSNKNTKAINPELKRTDIDHELSSEEQVCSCCQSPLKLIGYETTEQLDIIPAKYRILKHNVAKYACSKYEEHGITTVKVDKQPIKNSIATAGTLAHVLTSKYQHHLPLYRQEQILQDIGIGISRATMSHWCLRSAALLKVLYELMRQQLIQENDYLHLDDTRVTVLTTQDKNPQQNKRGQKVKQGYMWCYGNSQKGKEVVLYAYSDSRSGNVPLQFLAEYSGYIQADAYQAHKQLFQHKNQSDIKHRISVGCWAHCRRKFFEIAQAAPDDQGFASQMIEKIKKLYHIESELKKINAPPDKVKQTREEKAKPILNDIRQYIDDHLLQVPPKAPLGEAIAYTLNIWAELNIYTEDGRVNIDNNFIERAIRPFALSRKNWLFAGNTKGAEAAAIIYSIIETCKYQKIIPAQYLRFILNKIPNLKEDEKLENYLPQNIDRKLLI